jgi:hypothetical protein
MPGNLTESTKEEIIKQTIIAVNHYTDEDIEQNTKYEDLEKIELLKHLGIAPNMLLQLSIPLSKISKMHGGPAVGPFNVLKSKNVQDLCKIIFSALE